METKTISTFFHSAWERVRRFCYDKRLYFLVFFLPVLIMGTAYAFFDVHPFGDNSVLVLDLNGQYVYYYEAFRDAFWGKGSSIYNWSRNLSGEMFGIFAYYLASPFMLIICLLPRAMMPTSIMILQLAKIGTASVAFAFYIKKISPKTPRKLSLVVFPTMYALMSYMVVQLMDPMWLDGLIYLPLICWGVHRLVNEGKLLPYIIPLTLMFIAHFYIGYMVGIFTFFYFCCVCLSQEGRKLPKRFFSRCVSFGVGTLISLMCAAFVLIPVYNSLKLGKFEFTDPDFSMATQFDFLTFLTKMFPMSYDTVYPEGLPMVYCGIVAVILTPLFFLNNKITIKEKTSKGLLTLLIVILMYIKPADMAMHGFQVPNWLPFRYSFVFSFLVLIMAFRAFENLDGVTAKNIGGIVFGIVVFLMWCERENYEHFQLFETKQNDNGKSTAVIQGIWISLIAVCVYFAIIYLVKKYPRSKAVCFSMVAVLCVELFANCADTLDKIDKDVAYSKYTSYEPYMSNLRSAVDMMKKYDESPFYRMEATFHRTVNDPIGTGYYGISHSSSTMNAPALKMLQQLGYAYGGHYTKYTGATPITDALFDIKYLMNKTGDNSFNDSRIKIPDNYKLTTDYTVGNMTFEFYKNPNALGLGITANKRITNIKLSDKNPFENQNDVFSAISGNSNRYFTKLKILQTETENVTTSETSDGITKYVPTDSSISECHVDYVVKMNRDSDLYMYLPTKYERSCNVWVQDEDEYIEAESNMDYAGQFFEGDNYSIMNLGKFYKDQEVRIRITIVNDDNEAYWSDQFFYTFDTEGFEKACNEIKKNSLKITEFDDTYLEGTVNSENSEDVLLTTIPYENGWKIKVNGKTVTPQKSLNSLITIPLEKGENKITMKFSPSYWKSSVLISICGFMLMLIVFLVEYKNGKLFKIIMGIFKINYVAVPKIELDLNKKKKKNEIEEPDENNISVDMENYWKLFSDEPDERIVTENDVLPYVSDKDKGKKSNVMEDNASTKNEDDTTDYFSDEDFEKKLREILGDSYKPDKK